MNHTDTPNSRVRAIVAEVLAMNLDEIDDTADLFNHYQADSLNLIEIVAQVERQYRVVLPLNGLPRARSVSALCDLLTQVAA